MLGAEVVHRYDYFERETVLQYESEVREWGMCATAPEGGGGRNAGIANIAAVEAFYAHILGPDGWMMVPGLGPENMCIEVRPRLTAATDVARAGPGMAARMAVKSTSSDP